MNGPFKLCVVQPCCALTFTSVVSRVASSPRPISKIPQFLIARFPPELNSIDITHRYLSILNPIKTALVAILRAYNTDMKRRPLLLGLLGAAAGSILPAEKSSAHADGSELLGLPAPRFDLKEWINSPPLEITDLRGKVVLVRWWTDGCPYCQATAPAICKLQRNYSGRGFQPIGIYHPKPPGDRDIRKVEAAAKEKRFEFPIGLDADWTALKRWWLTRDRDWTSVSFVLDRHGIIRYVHPGGEFHEGTQGGLEHHEGCQRDLHAIDAKISQLLAS